MGKTKIEWATDSWQVTRGCSIVSAGCKNCYAMKMAHRFSGPGKPYEGLTRLGPNGPTWTGNVRTVPENLEIPLHWRKPRRVFIDSMSDLFHVDVPGDFIDRVMAVVALSPVHTYQLLTKRPERMREYMRDPDTPFRVNRQMDAVSVDKDMRGVGEQWRRVPGFMSYSVSNYGRVRSSLGAQGERELKSRNSGNGYRSVCLRDLGQNHERLIHALVLDAFVGPAPVGHECRHRNGDRTDNRIANLSWGTRGENMEDASRHGTAGAWMKSQARLDHATVAEVRRRREAGGLLKDIASEFSLSKQQVSAIAKGRIYKAARLQWPPENLWCGCSCEDQKAADERIPLLLQTPAAVRFVSLEPLLGPIDIARFVDRKGEHYAECVVCGKHKNPRGRSAPLEMASSLCDHDCDGYAKHPVPDQLWPGESAREFGYTHEPFLDWVIVGGESGLNARPMHPDWARSIRDQCVAAGVPFFFKQWGEINKRGRRLPNGPMWRVGKKAAGRQLDGREWNEFPGNESENRGL